MARITSSPSSSPANRTAFSWFYALLWGGSGIVIGILLTLLASPHVPGTDGLVSLTGEDQQAGRGVAVRNTGKKGSASQNTLQTPSSLAQCDRTFRVDYVPDGDSLFTQSGEEIRLLGMDAPEQDHALADRARSFVRKWIEPGDRVGVLFDRVRRDAYDRLLGYVYYKSPDGIRFLNPRPVRAGLAWCYLRKENDSKKQRFIDAQKTALSERRHLHESPEGDEPHYVRVGDQYRFHRPGCRVIGEFFDPEEDQPEDLPWMDTFENRLRPLTLGYSPCRICTP